MNKREKKVRQTVRVLVSVLLISMLFGEMTYAAEIEKTSIGKQTETPKEQQNNTDML